MAPILVEAELVTEVPQPCPEQIMFMPVGKHTIRPMVNGVQKEIEVEISAELVDLLQGDLTSRLNSNVRPHADFDHKPGPAAFLPKRFSWQEGKGVMVDVDWTGSGKKAITDRDYSFFSPSFLMSEDKIVGLPTYGAIGALTNTPAFRGIERIAASELGKATKKTMSKLLTQCVALGIVTDGVEDDAAAPLVNAAFTTLRDRVSAAETENAALKKTLATQLQKEAEAIVDAAIAEGRLAPKNTELRAFFVGLAASDPEKAKLVLAAYPVNGATKQVVNPKAGQVGNGAVVQGTENRINKINAAIAQVRASNRELTFAEANSIVRAASPELFQDEEVEHEE
jgi:hypothetical protein